MTRRQKRRRGFSLIESAIVLAVVGAVVGGIWVASKSLAQRRFEQKFMEGLLTLKNTAQKYNLQGETCLIDSLHYERPEFYPLIQPVEWTELGIKPDGKIDISMRIDCAGTSAFIPDEKYLNLRFWALKKTDYLPFFCKNLFPKVRVLCSRFGDCYLPDPATLDYKCNQPSTDVDIQIRVGRN